MRIIPGRKTQIIATPLYVDDALLAEIVLGERADRWRELRNSFERQGMPTARPSVAGLYYLPAQFRFFDAYEGLADHQEGYPEDGPDKFGP
jgi:hypothetical protein